MTLFIYMLIQTETSPALEEVLLLINNRGKCYVVQSFDKTKLRQNLKSKGNYKLGLNLF